ncbi:lipoprotein LpqH [Gulosibacter chungangensis]|uniref:Lipoprotein n=1 Tax=Gulosibacter chungangensis TaxID=979746 RepID=A0A7J5BA19_9MICO|nr:lipoprotein LpqH [Gulosibacter chungangensis]KAB1641955.1 hypothetical protein F8O05_11600 [Gulosibacter chungangensis]
MSNIGLLRKGIALAAIVPITVFGLSACAGASSEETAERTREPKATSPQSQSESDSTGGGSLPFPFPDGSDDASSDADASGGIESSDAGASGDSSGTGTSGSNGSGNSSGGSSSGGNSVVKYDDIDLSNVSWTTLCSSDSDSQYVIASDTEATGDETGPTLMISADEDGQPDYLFISEGTSDGATSLYWSSTADAGSVTMNFNGDKFSASGEAFYFSDYSYKNPISFEIQLTCDVMY